MNMTQVVKSMKVLSQTKLLGDNAQKTKKSESSTDEEYVKILDKQEKSDEPIQALVETNGVLRERPADLVKNNVEGIGIKIEFKDEMRMTLVYDDYITNTTSAAFYCSIAPQVKDCHGWSSITTYYGEYRVNSIQMIADLAKPGERHGTYATGRPSFVFGYSPVALTSFQKCLDNKHIHWIDPCPGKYIFRHKITKPYIYGGSSPKLHAPSFQLTGEATNFHNGYFTIACNESSDMVTGFPIAWYFDVTFKSRCDPY